MQLDIATHLELSLGEPTDLLLQIEAAHLPEQQVLRGHIATSPTEHFARVMAQDNIGERVWIKASGLFTVDYTARVEIMRSVGAIEHLAQLPTHLLPGEAIPYLMDSPYCPAKRFRCQVDAQFGGLSGGALVSAMRDWIYQHFTYAPATSDANTTALDSFIERRGVCRDFAHVLITFARAATIPARYASVYAPGVNPQDFHAVAEVFLADPNGISGSWHLVDPTFMAQAGEMAKIAIGRDAADASFITNYGPLFLNLMAIEVTAAPA